MLYCLHVKYVGFKGQVTAIGEGEAAGGTLLSLRPHSRIVLRALLHLLPPGMRLSRGEEARAQGLRITHSRGQARAALRPEGTGASGARGDRAVPPHAPDSRPHNRDKPGAHERGQAG